MKQILQPKADVYGPFKDDTKRLFAVISRDIRYVCIAAFLGHGPIPWTHFWKWLS